MDTSSRHYSGCQSRPGKNDVMIIKATHLTLFD